MGAALSLIYFVGFFVAVFVIRHRAGVGVWHRLKVFGPNGFGLTWLLWSSLKAMFWPATLAVWIATGRPEPRLVFNEKALARQRLG